MLVGFPHGSPRFVFLAVISFFRPDIQHHPNWPFSPDANSKKIEMLKGADNEYNLDYAVTATQKTILNAFGMSADNIHRQARGISTDLARIEAETFEKQTGGHAEGSV
jgi:hypothetical protein